jgi:hypothetical protein
MMTIDELREARFRFLNAVYEASGGDEYIWPDWSELAQPLGFDERLTHRILDYLVGEGLLKIWAAGHVGITHEGIREVENARTHPNQSTHYFPPVNVIMIGSMVNSVIQQASPGAHQAVQIDERTIKEKGLDLTQED